MRYWLPGRTVSCSLVVIIQKIQKAANDLSESGSLVFSRIANRRFQMYCCLCYVYTTICLYILSFTSLRL